MGLNNIKKIMKAFLEQVQDIEDLTQPFFDRLNIATQEGAQLDGIGEIVGQPREFFDDVTYRQLLFLRIVRNMSEGTPEELIEIFETMTGAQIVQYIEQFPAAFTLTAINPTYLFDYPYIWEAIQKAKPAAVGINGLIEAFETVFAFLDDTVGLTDGFADVVPPATPTVGGIFASLMPSEFITATNPLTLSPTGAFLTRRLSGCQSSHIMRVHRVIAADDVDIYDVQKGTSNYKLTELGSWIDGSSETFNIITLYDQSGSGNTFDAPATINRATLIFNQRNGWPVLRGDGTNHWYQSSVFGDQFMASDKATIFVTARPDNSFVTGTQAWELGNIYQDAGSWFALSVGTITPDTKMFAYNWRLTPSQEDYVGADFVDAEFSSLGWVYGSPILYFFKSTETSSNMAAVGQIGTQNYIYGINVFTQGIFGHNVGGSALFKGDISDVVLFNKVLAQSELNGINKYLLEN